MQRVYVVDDDESLRKALSFVLKGLDCDPVPYPSAEHFLTYVPHNEPGIVLLDVRMGQMTGLELQQRLIDTGIDWPVIFLSGHGDLEMAVETMMKGAVCFLQKPVRREKQLVTLAAQGVAMRAAAERLGIAQRTAEFHKASAMRKLGVHTVTELVEALKGVKV